MSEETASQSRGTGDTVRCRPLTETTHLYDHWDRRSAQPNPQVASAYFPALRGVCAMPPASPQSRMGTMLPTKCRWLEAVRLQHLPPAYLPCIFGVWVMRAKCLIPCSCRGVAQPGSAPALGAGGQEFKSPRPDQLKLLFFQPRSIVGRSKPFDFA